MSGAVPGKDPSDGRHATAPRVTVSLADGGGARPLAALFGHMTSENASSFLLNLFLVHLK
jgi:hypothetical protein